MLQWPKTGQDVLLVWCCLMTALYESKMAMTNSPLLDALLSSLNANAGYVRPVAMFASGCLFETVTTFQL